MSASIIFVIYMHVRARDHERTSLDDAKQFKLAIYTRKFHRLWMSSFAIHARPPGRRQSRTNSMVHASIHRSPFRPGYRDHLSSHRGVPPVHTSACSPTKTRPRNHLRYAMKQGMTSTVRRRCERIRMQAWNEVFGYRDITSPSPWFDTSRCGY